MVNDSVENQIVVAERPKDPALSTSATAAAATVYESSNDYLDGSYKA